MIPANPLLSLNPFYSNPGVDRIQPAFLSQFQADYDGDTVIGKKYPSVESSQERSR